MVAFPTLSYKPSTSTKYGDIENFTNYVTFGRGYSQRSAEYRNGIRRRLDLEYEYLGETDADTLRTFLETHSDGSAVDCPDWMADHDGAVVRKWFIENWSEKYASPLHHSFSIKLIEVFDPS
jgi:phage-related protein